jgi:hypothetical protein
VGHTLLYAQRRRSALASRTLERNWTPEDVERGLGTLALYGGNAAEAHRRLKAEGLPIPESTLKHWRTTLHVDRYSHIRAELAPKVQARAAELARTNPSSRPPSPPRSVPSLRRRSRT